MGRERYSNFQDKTLVDAIDELTEAVKKLTERVNGMGAIQSRIKELEAGIRPLDEIKAYIEAITHQCSCAQCQTRKSTLLWAFPGIMEARK